jgi:hypothetical protein
MVSPEIEEGVPPRYGSSLTLYFQRLTASRCAKYFQGKRLAVKYKKKGDLRDGKIALDLGVDHGWLRFVRGS